MTRSNRRAPLLALFLAGLVLMGNFASLVRSLAVQPMRGFEDFVHFFVIGFAVPVLYAGLGLLIVARQPGNRVGWLMLISALNLESMFSFFTGPLAEPPPQLTPGIWLYLWYENWSWILFIFPIFLIPLHFPDGKPPSRRWNWVNGLAVALWMFLAIISIFASEIGPVDGDWTVPNPLGLLPSDYFDESFFLFWGIGLVTIVGGSVASLFVRYRRSGQSGRDQIKWLLFAGAFFFLSYPLSYFLTDTQASGDSWGNWIFGLSLLVFPIAIAIAILRHRLYDINLIIRRALQYAIMTGLLALFYFGGVVTLQAVFTGLLGIRFGSPIITVVTTLMFAALFNPMRRGIQRWIDRRFFRAKYDAEQVLDGFARTVRDEVDLDQLAGSVLEVVDRTVRPARASLWLREGRSR